MQFLLWVIFYQLGEKLCGEIAEKFNLPTLINPMYITGVDTELLNDLKKIID